jgi:hypothetical protein
MAKVRDFRGDFSGPTENAPLTDVKVGDVVGFKSDHEQYGKIIAIISGGRYGRDKLRLRNEDGFSGDYLRYAKETEEDAADCWLD